MPTLQDPQATDFFHIPSPGDIAKAVLSDLSQPLSDIENAVNAVSGTIGTVEAKVAKVETKVATIADKIATAASDEIVKEAQAAFGALSSLPSISEFTGALEKTAKSDLNFFKSSSLDVKTLLTALLTSLNTAVTDVIAAIGISGVSTSILSDISKLIQDLPDAVLAPLSILLERLGITSADADILQKLSTIGPWVEGKMNGALMESTVVIVVKNIAKLIAVVADWVRDTVPITCNINGAVGGAAGAFADLGAEIEAISITQLILSPVSGFAGFLADLLDDLS